MKNAPVKREEGMVVVVGAKIGRNANEVLRWVMGKGGMCIRLDPGSLWAHELKLALTHAHIWGIVPIHHAISDPLRLAK